MKKLLFIVLILITANTFAQTQKGDWLVGGTVGFETKTGSSNITVAPNAGYFIKNNFAAGIDFGLASNKMGTEITTDFELGPFARYYFGHANFRPFTMLKVSYITENIQDTNPNVSITQNGFGYTLGVGAAAFFSPDVAFEGMFGYNFSQYATAESSKGLGLSIGFQVYLNRHKGKK